MKSDGGDGSAKGSGKGTSSDGGKSKSSESKPEMDAKADKSTEVSSRVHVV